MTKLWPLLRIHAPAALVHPCTSALEATLPVETNNAPIVDAGENTSTNATLMGHRSFDVDGDSLTYRWSLAHISDITLFFRQKIHKPKYL